MDRENDDSPIGWRSIYSDDRDAAGGDHKRRNGVTEAERERSAGERASGAESAAAEEPAATADEAVPPRVPPRQGAPDVGYPREFRSAASEEAFRKRQSSAAEEEQAEPAEPSASYRRRKPRPLLWSFFIALGLVVIAAASALFYLWNGLRPTPASDTPVRVTIEKGMRANSVAEELEQKGLIRNAFLFSMWLKLKNEGSRFQAGEYDMLPGITRDEIVAKLNAGATVAAATIRFTIPEGFTVEQIADRLAKEGFVNKEKFLQAAGKPDQVSDSVWTKQIPNTADMRYPLEGYMFPETYELRKGATEQDIINRMVSELDRKLSQLPDDWQTTMQERHLTLHQLLTIASLVEREVVLDEERPIVASVIENRLNKKMPLQIDATIQYVLGKQKEKLTTEDTKIDSPYNTYLHTGLPPGPIASPSLKSIEAALYPADTEYLYYVTKKDGSNQHLFAITYKQHQKNIQASEKNAKQ